MANRPASDAAKVGTSGVEKSERTEPKYPRANLMALLLSGGKDRG